MTQPHGNQTICRAASYERSDAGEEMSAFDQLGPRTKRAMLILPLKVSATAILRQIKFDLMSDPRDQYTDARVAIVLASEVRRMIASDAAPGEAMRKDYALEPRRRAAGGRSCAVWR